MTNEQKEAVNKLKIELPSGYHFVEVNIEKPIVNKVLLKLDRYIHSPYYIQNSKTIHFFGSEDALMLTLNGNNLENYLNSLS